MLIDTHAHLNFNAYKEDADQVISRSLENEIWIINVGSQYETSKRAVMIAGRYEKGVYASVGLHPIHLANDLVKIKLDQEEIAFQGKEENFDYQKYKELAQSKKVIAIGEVGLDFYWKPKTKKKLEQFKENQKEVFLKQVALAKELNLPLIFHCRMAHQELIEMLKKIKNQNKNLKGVIHCFTGNWLQAKEYLKMGFYLGFNGLIFKMDFKEIIKKTPLRKILVETDCPYLTPPSLSGRNEPLYLTYVVQKIAEIKNINFEKIAQSTTQNAKELFQLL